MGFLSSIAKGIGNFVGSISPVSWLGSALNIGGSLLDRKNVKDTNSAQMQLAQYQFDKALEMWNMNNEYNSPSSQMQRLKEAGLNPNLVYGNGSVVGNSSSSAPSYDAPTLQAYTGQARAASESMMSILQGQQLENLKFQNDNLAKQGNLLDAQARKTNVEADRISGLYPGELEYQTAHNQREWYEYRLAAIRMAYQSDLSAAEIKRIENSAALTERQTKFIDAQESKLMSDKAYTQAKLLLIPLEAELMKRNIRMSDQQREKIYYDTVSTISDISNKRISRQKLNQEYIRERVDNYYRILGLSPGASDFTNTFFRVYARWLKGLEKDLLDYEKEPLYYKELPELY